MKDVSIESNECSTPKYTQKRLHTVGSGRFCPKVNVYYANAVEVGGGGVTHIEQSVVLPLYVTQLSHLDIIGVGVDYDELILNLAAVRPVGIPGGEAPAPVDVIHRSNPSGADFMLDLRGLGQPGTGHLAHRHVADLVFNYSGPGEAGDGTRCPLQGSLQNRAPLMPSIAANLRFPCSYAIVKVFGTAGQRCVTLNLGKSENQL